MDLPCCEFYKKNRKNESLYIMQPVPKYLFYSCCLFLYLWTATAQAQQTKQYDAVYLKDSSVVYGQIMRYEPTGVLVLQLDNGTTLEYPADQILKTKKETIEVTTVVPIDPIDNTLQSPSVPDFKQRLYGWGAVGNTFGEHYERYVMGFSIDLGMGHRFHDAFMLGGGAGLTTEYVQSIAYVYGSIRGSFLKRSFSPFYQMDIGYGVPLGTDPYRTLVELQASGARILKREGGVYLHPAIGFRFAAANTVHTYLAVGCQIQSIRYFGIDWNNYSFTERGTFIRPTLRFGIVF